MGLGNRLLATTMGAALVVAGLGSTATAEQTLDAALLPPAGQTAVKAGDTLRFDGPAPHGSTVEAATLVAVSTGGGILRTWDVTSRVKVEGGDLEGSLRLFCSHIPGCVDGNASQRAQLAGYLYDVSVVADGNRLADRSNMVDFDERQPRILSYSLVETDRVVVRFDEDVVDPEGDSAADWTVNRQAGVRQVSGFGDTRELLLFQRLDPDATPEIRYSPVPSVVPQQPNVPYVDGARNYLRAEHRFALAADRIPPEIPSIDAIAGTASSGDPVLGADATPDITVGGVVEGHAAEVYLDDGDGAFEASRDTFVGEQRSTGGDTIVAWQAAPLSEGDHRLFARARDQAACDPNDPSGGTCPNWSGRSEAALYDLDLTPPAPVPPALATTGRVVVPFSEDVVGSDSPGHWTITAPDGSAGPTVTDVEGAGDTRILHAALVADGSELTYLPPGSDPYRDEHGNTLERFSIAVVVDLPVLTIEGGEADEGDGPEGQLDVDHEPQRADLTVRLAEPAPEDVTVSWRTRAGTAGADADYRSGSGEITIGAGATQATIGVELVGDRSDEHDETFEVVLSNPHNARFAGERTEIAATGTILDDDPLATLTATASAVEEGGVAEIRVSPEVPSGKDIIVGWATSPDTATADQDFDRLTGELTIPAGALYGTIEIPTRQDEVDEDDERFNVDLGSAENARLRDSSTQVTIRDDDAPPALRITDVEVQEGDDGTVNGRLDVTLSARSEREVRVRYRTQDGSAIRGSDYESDSGELRFTPGAIHREVVVTVLGDTLHEGDETFEIALTDPVHASMDDALGTVTILDDDPRPADGPGDGDDGDGDDGDGGLDPRGLIDDLVGTIGELLGGLGDDGGDGDGNDGGDGDNGGTGDNGGDGDTGDGDDGGFDPQKVLGDVVEALGGLIDDLASGIDGDDDGGDGGDGTDGGDGGSDGGSVGGDGTTSPAPDAGDTPDLPRTGGGLAGFGLLSLLGGATILRRRR